MKFKFKHKKISPFISYMLLFFIFFALLAVIISIYNGYRADIDNKNLISKLDKSDKEVWDALNQKTYSLSDDKDFTIGLNGIYYQDKLVPCLKATDWWKIKKLYAPYFPGNEIAVTDGKNYIYFSTVGNNKREGFTIDLKSIINLSKESEKGTWNVGYTVINNINKKTNTCSIKGIFRSSVLNQFYEKINNTWHYCSLNKDGFNGNCTEIDKVDNNSFASDTNPTDKVDAHDKNHKYLKGKIVE